ncbi:MAG: NAD(+)/NADH kinase [Thermoanaerobaculia bacterium]|nr:NAD(+)/NADH kinase [Thermoanaerobaculia bacterium]
MSETGGIREVAIVAKLSSRDAIRTAHELADWLGRRGVHAALDESIARSRVGRRAPEFDIANRYDLVVVLGGDGTLLSVARAVPDGVPILGVNLGNLGFLTEIGRTELYASLVKIFEGRSGIEERSMLDVELIRADGGSSHYRILNDAVIAKSALARIIQIELRVDGRLVTSYRSDGLIISTPTGSTAYNLSAGGPIVNPLLAVVVLTPICPHTFSFRPIVVPDASTIEATLETQSEEVYLTLDGQEGTTLGYRDTIRVTRCAQSARLVKVSDRTFYHGLRGKLHWGE